MTEPRDPRDWEFPQVDPAEEATPLADPTSTALPEAEDDEPPLGEGPFDTGSDAWWRAQAAAQRAAGRAAAEAAQAAAEQPAAPPPPPAPFVPAPLPPAPPVPPPPAPAVPAEVTVSPLDVSWLPDELAQQLFESPPVATPAPQEPVALVAPAEEVAAAPEPPLEAFAVQDVQDEDEDEDDEAYDDGLDDEFDDEFGDHADDHAIEPLAVRREPEPEPEPAPAPVPVPVPVPVRPGPSGLDLGDLEALRPQPSGPADLPPLPPKRNRLRVLFGALLALAGVALGIGALFLVRDTDPLGDPTVTPVTPVSPTSVASASPTTSPTATPTASPTASPSQTPTTAATATPTVAPPPTALAPIRPVTVLNNSRVKNLAAKTAARLNAAGWPTPTVGNYTGGNIAVTTVYYAPGQLASAQRLAREFDIGRVLPRFSGLPGSGLTLVLTRDYA